MQGLTTLGYPCMIQAKNREKVITKNTQSLEVDGSDHCQLPTTIGVESREYAHSIYESVAVQIAECLVLPRA